jgi:hypothetical protein
MSGYVGQNLFVHLDSVVVVVVAAAIITIIIVIIIRYARCIHQLHAKSGV